MHNFKTFDSFVEGINEIRELVPILEKYMVEKSDDHVEEFMNSPEELASHLMDIVSKNFPTEKRSYSISVSSFEVGFKTTEDIAFGWKPHLDGTYSFRITLFDNNNLHNAKESNDQYIAGSIIISTDENGKICMTNLNDVLKEHGWESVEIKKYAEDYRNRDGNQFKTAKKESDQYVKKYNKFNRFKKPYRDYKAKDTDTSSESEE